MSKKEKCPQGLTVDEVRRLVERINYNIRKFPRLIGTLVTTCVPTSISEITSGYKDETVFPNLDGESERMLGWTAEGMGHSPMVGLAQLLECSCDQMLRITVDWEAGVPRLTVY